MPEVQAYLSNADLAWISVKPVTDNWLYKYWLYKYHVTLQGYLSTD